MISSRDAREFTRAREAFIAGMLEKGYLQGRNYVLDVRYSNGDEQLARVIREAAASAPDVMVVGGLLQAKLAKETTSTVPIVVATASDPVDAGLIPSLSRPGGNLTGFGDLADDTVPKRVELVRELLPRARNVLFLADALFPTIDRLVASAESTARRLSLQSVTVRVADRESLERALAALPTARHDALVLLGASPFIRNQALILQGASAAGIPVIHFWLPQADMGALATHGADPLENFRQSSRYVDRILKGTPPGDLPFEFATRFELVINLRTAKSLNIAVPAAVLQRADRVIE